MSCPQGCSVGASLDQEHVEDVGRQALAGEVSWREAARITGVRRDSLKKHMEDHVLSAAEAAHAEASAEQFNALVAQAKAELLEQFHLSAADIKPLILVALKNLDGLAHTKPSADVLVRTLKTIQEMTGMKQEQRLMLDYARAQRRRERTPLYVENERLAIEGVDEDEQ